MSEPPKIPPHGRLAGIDFGTVRVGVAVCDPDRILASPLLTHVRRGEAADREFFQQLAVEERLVGVVVGLPVHMSGDDSEKSRAAREFGEWLGTVTKLPVWYQDERFTTSEADSLLAQRGKRRAADPRRDMLAAREILARFLEAGEHRPPGPLED